MWGLRGVREVGRGKVNEEEVRVKRRCWGGVGMVMGRGMRVERRGKGRMGKG